jgi:hypothetical protein
LFPLLVLQRTCELIKDSSLWLSNLIPLVRDSIIIIVGVCYFILSVHVSFINVGLRFSIKNLNFSFLGANIPILFVGSQSVSVEVHIIWYQSQVLKSGLLSFYLLFIVIILSCSVCVHYSLFLFCFVTTKKHGNTNL